MATYTATWHHAAVKRAARSCTFMKRAMVVVGAPTRVCQPRPAEVEPVVRVAAGSDVCFVAHSAGAEKCKQPKNSF